MQKKCLANSKDLRKCLFVLHSLFEIVNFKSVCSYYFTASQILLRGSSLRQSVTLSASITWTYENVYASLRNCIKNFTETIITKEKQSKDEMSNMVSTSQVIVAMCLAMCSDEISRQKVWLIVITNNRETKSSYWHHMFCRRLNLSTEFNTKCPVVACTQSPTPPFLLAPTTLSVEEKAIVWGLFQS